MYFIVSGFITHNWKAEKMLKYTNMCIICLLLAQEDFKTVNENFTECWHTVFNWPVLSFDLYSLNDVPVFCENCANDIC